MARIERRADGHSMSCRHERVCPLRKLMVLDSYGEMFEPWVMRDDAVLGLVRTSRLARRSSSNLGVFTSALRSRSVIETRNCPCIHAFCGIPRCGIRGEGNGPR